ncbi:hypothetical protein L226DRAFT_171944 [Lentinus tigrinus ALCF2SS1-7]|uniref:Uncharacterized protein n=1 Tax=Lentinus tigrinus ALCF2SS1-6 TaxID=1328759 RepID=A0A5C2S040_9APHY|nr:hypothetical protein L227DRAFT_249124 [Lentinus tigrinus ALCF2SS1-6]RPD71620.1 hypothetical protein L226DRAFT_171944 [Lentinus tigrinus ALCF2SS1-7]
MSRGSSVETTSGAAVARYPEDPPLPLLTEYGIYVREYILRTPRMPWSSFSGGSPSSRHPAGTRSPDSPRLSINLFVEALAPHRPGFDSLCGCAASPPIVSRLPYASCSPAVALLPFLLPAVALEAHAAALALALPASQLLLADQSCSPG